MPFTIEDDVLIAYHGSEEVVTIPEGVKSIGEGAFRGNDRVRIVQMDTDVYWIMPEAFMDCTSLEFVTLHLMLDEIGDRAFKGCRSLRDVDRTIADVDYYCELIRIGDEAFAGCASLKKLELDSPWQFTVGSRAFADCTALTHVALPDGLAELAHDAFERCTSLRYVSLPEAFRGSESQHRVFEEAVQAIRDCCPNIVAIEGRKASTTRGGTELPWTTGTLAHAIESLRQRSMSYADFADQRRSGDAVGLFKGYAELEDLDLAGFDTSGEKSLACLFKGCAKLRSIDLSPLDTSSVEDMRQMFFGCRSLKEVDLSCLDTSQVQTMAHLFHNCHALRRVSLHGLDLSRVKSLWSAFDHCESLEDLDLTVSTMPPAEKTKYLFRGCTSIKRWEVSEAWPVGYDTIPEPTSAYDEWWSEREQRWMTERQIIKRGPASDVFTSERRRSPAICEPSAMRHAGRVIASDPVTHAGTSGSVPETSP